MLRHGYVAEVQGRWRYQVSYYFLGGYEFKARKMIVDLVDLIVKSSHRLLKFCSIVLALELALGD